MLTDYIRAAMKHAKYEIIDDGTFFATIPGLDGLWANAPTLEECREELQSTLEDWILVGVRRGHTIPIVDGIDLNILEPTA
ncbi:MAG: type II toxin-antitoxin system HicB family antitoxin [Chloroflexi bacterium]|nr:type II toxin-antitoxin system HicB family antitoxin [Chloroflexota bacterium]